MRWLRRQLLSITAAFSFCLLLFVVVQWAGWFPAALVGRDRIVEATRNQFVLDDDEVQLGRRGLWIGRCRVIVMSPLGHGTLSDDKEAWASRLRRTDVSRIDNLSPPLGGFGSYAGSSIEPVGVAFLRFELDGYLFPAWAIVALTALFPAIWVVWRVRRWWASPLLPEAAEGEPAEPGAAADGGGM